MVQDEQGRWWAKHRETGEWNYYDGSTWVRATPPGYEGVAPAPTTNEGSPPQHLAPSHLETEGAGNRRTRRAWVLAVGLAGMVALIAVGVYLLANNVGGSEMAKVPDVVGKPRDEAEKVLESDGFDVEVKVRQSSGEAAGNVVQQSPSGGGEAKRGSEVAITVGEASTAQNEPGPEEASRPAPGYDLVQDPTGSVELEVPADWTVLKGSDSEYPGLPVKNWSNWANENIISSITATPNITDWHDLDPPVSGAYVVASRVLAQQYTDDELVYSTLYAGQADNCQRGPAQDFRRSSLSGKMQTWYNCREQGITNFVVAAHPEGRDCVAVLQARRANRADREAIEHVLDTLRVDCEDVAKAEIRDATVASREVSESIPSTS